MTILKLKYVNSYRDRHGKLRHYFRRGKIRGALKGAPGSAEFMSEYQRLLALHAPKPTRKPYEKGTLGWVVQKYKAESADWKAAKPQSRTAYERTLVVLSKYNDADFASFDENGLRRIRNSLKDRPSVADNAVRMIGRLWRWAKEYIDGMANLGANPSTEVASLNKHHEPHKAWPPELCAKMEAHHDARLVRAYYLLRYTGQRCSDVAAMKSNQFDGTAVELFQIKTGTYVWLPAHSALQAHLKGHTGDWLLLNRWGKPYTAKSLSARISETCRDLGFDGYTAHGLRHLAGASLAEAGCSVHEIMSVLGHVTEEEAMKYVKQANRKKMAGSALRKWNTSGTYTD